MPILYNATETEASTGFFDNLLRLLSDFAMHTGLRLLAAIAVLIIGLRAVRALNRRYIKSKAYEKLEPDVRGIVRWLLSFLLNAAVIIGVIAILGIPLTSVATVISSAALALGLSLQGSLANLAGGIVLLIFKPFHVNDVIEVSSFSGTVESIGVFYTSLRTFDNRCVILPNAGLSNANLINNTCYDTRRVDITVSTGSETDSETVKGLVTSVIAAQHLALLNPEPFVRLNDCTDGRLNYAIRVWCKTDDYYDLYHNLQEDLRREFKQMGLSPATPQMTVRIEKNAEEK